MTLQKTDIPSQIQITKSVLNGTIQNRVDTVAKFATALNLGEQVEIHHHMSKAHKGERITTPHLIPELWELEKQFYGLLDRKKVVETILKGIGIKKGLWKGKWGDKPLYKGDGTPFTEAELDELQEVLTKALSVSETKVKKLILKAALVGKITGIRKVGKRLKIDLSKLPKTLREALKTAGLTIQEVRSIQYAQELAAINVTSIQQRTESSIKRMVVQAQFNRTHPRQLAQKMFREISDDDGALDRDWERVAITEMNRASSDGFIANQPDGEYVVGNAHDDACSYCHSMIEGKVYRVNHDGATDYDHLPPDSDEYKKLNKQWEQEIWVGKSNVNRAFAKRKRTPEGLQPREEHELAKPVIPLHPNCRCTYTPFMPDMAYIKDGKVKFVLGDKDEKERVQWVKRNKDLFQGQFEEQQLIGG